MIHFPFFPPIYKRKLEIVRDYDTEATVLVCRSFSEMAWADYRGGWAAVFP